jgi:hypothetical protein
VDSALCPGRLNKLFPRRNMNIEHGRVPAPPTDRRRQSCRPRTSGSCAADAPALAAASSPHGATTACGGWSGRYGGIMMT